MLPHVEHGDAGRREGGGHIGGDRDVVESDDGHLLRHADPVLSQLAEDADGHRIVEADDGGQPSIEQFAGAGHAPFARERLRDDGELHVRVVRALPQSGDAIGDGVELERAGHDADAAMPQLGQVPSDRDARTVVVRKHGVDGEMVVADDCGAAPRQREVEQGLRHALLATRVGVARSGDDDRADALSQQRLHLCELAVRGAVGLGDLHRPVLERRAADHAAGDLGEVGVADLVHHEADRRHESAGETPCVHVGFVSQLLRDPPHMRRDFRRDSGAAGHGS